MKNLMIYINPKKDFDDEGSTAIKIQITNSFDLGWKRQDLILVTNFPYEYKGIESVVVGNHNYCSFCPPASKINAILDLFEQKLIEKDEIYWFHDLDAFQLYNIRESELELDGMDLLLPDFGRIPRWSTGSFFFKFRSEEIFKQVKEVTYKYAIDEESALCILTGDSSLANFDSRKKIQNLLSTQLSENKDIAMRIRRANITYNFHSFNLRSNYARAAKPVRVAHFHLIERVNPLNPRPNQIDFFLHGKNKLNVQIVPERLIKIFKKYGVN